MAEFLRLAGPRWERGRQAQPVYPALRGHKDGQRVLEAKARDLAGLKGYVSNLAACPDGTPVPAEFVIGAYRRLFQIEKSFRMSEHDLQARPVCRHGRDSVDAHLTLCPSRWRSADGSKRRLAGRSGSPCAPARRCRTIELRVGARTLTAAGLLPDDGYGALDRIGQRSRARSWWPGSGY